MTADPWLSAVSAASVSRVFAVVVVVVLAVEALAQLQELVDFSVESVKFRIHRYTIVSKILISQHLTLIFECGLISHACSISEPLP